VTSTDWFENDTLFRQELELGHQWTERIASHLVGEGLDAIAPEMVWRQSIEDRKNFADEQDIIVRREDILIESKSRRLHFTDDPESFPYTTAMVDTVSGWDQKATKPRAVVIVSQMSGSMLVVPVNRTRESWGRKSAWDRVRQIEDEWYIVDRSLLVPMSDLVAWLKGSV
jgi:hypothetical protein